MRHRKNCNGYCTFTCRLKETFSGSVTDLHGNAFWLMFQACHKKRYPFHKKVIWYKKMNQMYFSLSFIDLITVTFIENNVVRNLANVVMVQTSRVYIGRKYYNYKWYHWYDDTIFAFYFSGTTRDIGTCLTRIVIRHRAVESRMKTLSGYVIESKFILKFARFINILLNIS